VNIAYTIGLAFALGTYAILTIGAYRILQGTTTIGSLLEFSIYLTYVAGAVTPLMGLNPAIQQALVALQRIFTLLDSPGEAAPAAPRTTPLQRGPIRGRVEFEDVSYRYGEDGYALSNISLVAEPGESIALVGRSGAGKSTLVHLIPRLADPESGAVRIDGIDVRDYELTALRSRIGYVPQEVFLFNRSVRENIAYGRPGATDAEIRAAAIAAHADEFVSKLPKGYDSIVGERGVKLSGGERQRLAIAREILRDPPILILDEATSSLDSESEQLIRDAIERLKRDRTCFIIAHRLSTVISADRILVLDRSRVVETGTHRELLDHGGMYARLHAASGLISDE
jgi:ABC-type multidrug transport system fused ATPase/permease subunit